MGKVTDRWSVGNRRQLQPGTRFYLIRLGSEPRGLVGSGWTTSEPFDAPHWDLNRAAEGIAARFADIYFDVLEEKPLIDMQELNTAPFSDFHWSTQMSGIQIPSTVAEAIETLWNKRTHEKTFGLEELQPGQNISEGHAKQVLVNKYERSSKARALCLAHYGLRCSVCNLLLSDLYGPLAFDLIHVHHLTPLAEIQSDYVVDPIRDLRPVCPNCHAVIHSQQPPLTVDAIKSALTQQGNNLAKTGKSS